MPSAATIGWLAALLAAAAPGAVAAGPGAVEPTPVATPATAEPAVSPMLRLSEAIEHYDVQATSLADFVAQMQTRKAGGEGDWPGRTQATLQLGYRLVPTAAGCRIDDLDVALDVVIRLPRWEPATVVRRPVRDRWERMKAGISIHERGHRDIAVAVAGELADRLHAFVPPADADCDAVGRILLRERMKAQLRHATRDQTYDQRTRHGLTQVPEAPAKRRASAPTPPASARVSGH